MHFPTTYDEWRASLFLPIMGGDGDDDPDPADPDPADPDPADPADPEADPADPEEDPADPEDDPEDEPDEEGRREQELAELRDKLAKAEVAARNAKAEARKAREAAAKKGGDWEQVAKEREAELADANERAQTNEVRAVEAEENLDKFRREVRVTRIASKLHFRDPADASALLPYEDTGDDKTAERSLRKLAEKKPYLVDLRRARGRAMGDGNGNGGGPSFEEISRMTPQQVQQAIKDGTLQKALVRGPTR